MKVEKNRIVSSFMKFFFLKKKIVQRHRLKPTPDLKPSLRKDILHSFVHS